MLYHDSFFCILVGQFEEVFDDCHHSGKNRGSTIGSANKKIRLKHFLFRRNKTYILYYGKSSSVIRSAQIQT